MTSATTTDHLERALAALRHRISHDPDATIVELPADELLHNILAYLPTVSAHDLDESSAVVAAIYRTCATSDHR